MRPILAAIALCVLSGCSTLADYGIGGPLTILCREGKAEAEDRIVGSDQARLSVMRRLKDADALCPQESRIAR